MAEQSWVEKQSGVGAPERVAAYSERASGSWVEAQSGVAAPERAKSFSERMAEAVEVKAEYFAVPYVNGRHKENDYSVIPTGGGGGSLPFQISGGGNSWSVSGGFINRNKVEGISVSARSFEAYIDVIGKAIVLSTNADGLYVPIGRVVDGVAESWLTSNILTSKESNTNSDGSTNSCPFYYWGV